MVNAVWKIIIDNEAKIALKEAYQYIKKDSFQNAEKVKTGISKSIEELIKYPTKYPPDRFRKDKNISFRAYEIFRYRITYHVSNREIKIIRIGIQREILWNINCRLFSFCEMQTEKGFYSKPTNNAYSYSTHSPVLIPLLLYKVIFLKMKYFKWE